MYLAAAGVGTLGIVEFDTVDESNLQRQIIHGQSDIGRSKAESARATRSGRSTRWSTWHPRDALDSDNVMEIFSQYDLIVDGTDNFATRYMVNDAAVLLGKPYVWGSIYRFDGQASVFWAEHGPCYRCLYPEPPPPGMVPVLRRGRRARRAVRVDRLDPGHRGDQAAHRHRRAAGRPADGLRRPGDDVPQDQGPQGPELRALRREPDVTELIDYEDFCGAVSAEAAGGGRRLDDHRRELKDWQDAGKDFFLVDVREPAEYEIVSIPGATLIPKGEILSGEALAQLPQDRQIVLHCKSGVRSAEALAALKAAGFRDAVHVQGGVISWATRIDPSLPTY